MCVGAIDFLPYGKNKATKERWKCCHRPKLIIVPFWISSHATLWQWTRQWKLNVSTIYNIQPRDNFKETGWGPNLWRILKKAQCTCILRVWVLCLYANKYVCNMVWWLKSGSMSASVEKIISLQCRVYLCHIGKVCYKFYTLWVKAGKMPKYRAWVLWIFFFQHVAIGIVQQAGASGFVNWQKEHRMKNTPDERNIENTTSNKTTPSYVEDSLHHDVRWITTLLTFMTTSSIFHLNIWSTWQQSWLDHFLYCRLFWTNGFWFASELLLTVIQSLIMKIPLIKNRPDDKMDWQALNVQWISFRFSPEPAQVISVAAWYYYCDPVCLSTTLSILSQSFRQYHLFDCIDSYDAHLQVKDAQFSWASHLWYFPTIGTSGKTFYAVICSPSIQRFAYPL